MSELLYSQANINRNEINLLPTPEAMGRFHHPYSFGQYIDDIENGLSLSGLKIANEEYEVTHGDNRLFGVMEVEPIEGELITAEDWKLLIGLRGSHDQRIPRGLSLGNQVMVCSNLCFSGSLGTMNTKQTTNIGNRIPTLIKDAVSRIPELAYEQEKIFNRYKEVEMTPRQGDSALVELHRRNALNSNQLSRAIHEWDKPSYEDHTQYGRSVWQLFNASTESLKPTGNSSNSDTVRQRSELVSSFMNEVAGL